MPVILPWDKDDHRAVSKGNIRLGLPGGNILTEPLAFAQVRIPQHQMHERLRMKELRSKVSPVQIRIPIRAFTQGRGKLMKTSKAGTRAKVGIAVDEEGTLIGTDTSRCAFNRLMASIAWRWTHAAR